jgi:hypothetical protein
MDTTQNQAKDSRGWGENGYMVKGGYYALLHKGNLLEKSNIWYSDWLPKVNILCWTLSHKKIRTGENICKRGSLGPFNYALCRKNSESISHLFLESEFAKKVWQIVYSKLIHQVS